MIFILCTEVIIGFIQNIGVFIEKQNKQIKQNNITLIFPTTR